nr:hypothetical protein [Candidatus Dependentiae bacterium]
MKYGMRAGVLMVVSLLLGSHAQGMEVTVTQEESPVTSATLSRWDSSKT